MTRQSLDRCGLAAVLGLLLVAGRISAQQPPVPSRPPSTPSLPSPPSSLDFQIYRDRVQPVFLDKRKGFARCYVCHSQGTPFRLQRLSAGKTTWNEEETKKNFDAIQRLIAPGKPEASRLLLMPLAHEAGGTEFHPGGKRWASKDDAEWKEIAQWVKTASR